LLYLNPPADLSNERLFGQASSSAVADNTLLFEGADSFGAELHFDFFAVNGFGLKIWLPDFLGVALRKADVVAVLFAFAGYITDLHDVFLKTKCYSLVIQLYILDFLLLIVKTIH
jgi:hypothetical protein